MGTWVDLFEDAEPLIPKPHVVSLVIGPATSLVIDRFVAWSSKYTSVTYGFESLNTPDPDLPVAHVLIDPDATTLERVAEAIRRGRSESFFISTTASSEEWFALVKKKAQANKLYYTIKSPSTDASIRKMVSYFISRWAVSDSQAFKVCASLDYDPSAIYMFDKMFTTVTGGAMLPSKQTSVIIDNILGRSTQSLVAKALVTGEVLHGDYAVEFTQSVLSYLSYLLRVALQVKAAMMMGNQSLKDVSTFTGMPIWEISDAMSLADMYSSEKLETMTEVIEYGLRNKEEKETLSALSMVLSR